MKKSVVVLTLLLSCVLILGAAGCTQLEPSTSTDPGVASSTVAPETTTTVEVTTTIAQTGPPNNWIKHELPNEPTVAIAQDMVYDPNIGKMVVFGGTYAGDDPQPHDDVWLYDPVGNDWTRIENVDGPGGRADYSMVYVPTTGKILFFAGWMRDPNGGEGDYMATRGLWAYDATTNTWSEPDPQGNRPSARYGQAMVYDPSTEKVLMFGGYNNKNQNLRDFWAYDPIANTWELLHPSGDAIVAYSSPTMAYDPRTEKILLHGASDTWSYDSLANKWTKLKPKGSPGYRPGAKMVYHPGSELMILFGGGTYEAGYPTTLWGYDSVANTWTKIDPADRIPYGRTGHSMAYDPNTGNIIMYGGFNGRVIHDYSPGLTGTWTLAP